MTLSSCAMLRRLAVIAAIMMMCEQCMGASPPQILSINVSGGQVTLSFSSEAGVQYCVQQTSSIQTPTWSVLACLTGSGSSVFVADTNSASPQRFYRVVASQFMLYSVNVAGYVNVTLPSNWSLIANPFLGPTQLNQILAVVPDSAELWKVGVSDFEYNLFFDGLWYDSVTFNASTTTLRPGEGALFFNPGPAFTETFVGFVAEGALTNKLPTGLSLCSSIVPQSGAITTVLGFPTQNNAVLYQLNPDAQSYNSYSYSAQDQLWDPAEPTIAAGESFWVESNSALNWARNFTASGGGSSYTVTNQLFIGSRGGLVPTNSPAPQPPSISVQPQSRTNIVGDTVAFTVTASGSGLLQYQWRLGTNPIPGATLSNYTIVNVQATNAGNYSVVISNPYGSITSAVATLGVDVCAPAPAGLVSWWRGEGNAVDSLWTNQGTLTNGATFAQGKVGQAFSFDGVNDYLLAPTPAIHVGTGDFSLVGWAKTTSTKDYNALISFDAENAASAPALSVRGSGALRLWPAADSSVSGFNDGEFHHFAIVRVAGIVTYFKDGQPGGAASFPNFLNANAILIGGTGYAGEQFPGLIDEVAVFNRALSSNEIAALYAAGSAGMCPETRILVNGTAGIGSITVTNSAQVQINTTIANPVIFYTLNGAYPGTGPIYQGPFTLSQSATLRALAYPPDFSTSIESAVVVVTVVNAPSILQQPQAQTRLVGQTANFQVEAAGSGALSYQWYFGSNALANATNSTLVIPNVQSTNAGTYKVLVQNNYGSVLSATASLSVFEPARITVQPQSVVVGISNSVSFSVGAAGSGPFRYQWRQNGVNIPGETNAVFTRAAISITDGGTYTVVVANDYGTVISVPATLTIIFTLVQPSDSFAGAVLISGTNGIISGSSGDATKEPGEPNHAGKNGGRSVWYRWQAPVNGVVSFDMVGSTFDTLLAVYTGTNLTNLMVVASSDDYEGPGEVVNPLTSAVKFYATAGVTYYIAIDGSGASGGYFVLSWNLEVVADVPPLVTQQPRDTSAVLGGSAQFSVVAVGTPPLSYQWVFNGQWISGATNATYVVSSAQLTNIGHYAVLVGNSVGSYLSALATLELISAAAEPTQNKFEDIENTLPMGGFANLNPKGPPTFVSPSSGTIGYDFFDNTSSSGSPFDPAHCAIGGASRWLAFLPQINGMMSVDTITSQVATVVAVYRASRLTELVPENFVACDVNSAPDGHSLVRFEVTAGTIYSVLVDGLDGAKGQIYLHYCLGTVPVVATALSTPVVREGTTLMLTGAVSGGDPPPVYQWYRNGQVLNGATGVSYTDNNFSAEEAGIYSLVASNCLGISSNVVARVTTEVPLTVNFLASYSGGQFDFHVTGNASRSFVIQASTNFLNWIPLYTNLTPMAPVNFADPASARQPLRFYRAIPWGE